MSLKSLARLVLLSAALCSCSGNVVTPISGTTAPSGGLPVGNYIKHVVVIVQENRTFENLFAGWPGADAPMSGYLHTGKRIALREIRFADDQDMCHTFNAALLAWNHGKMDSFDRNTLGTFCQNGAPLARSYPYSYLAHADIAPYRAMAKQYVLADHMFPTEFGTSFTAHQDLIAGTTQINATKSLVDTPDSAPWGCDAPPGTTTDLVDENRKVTPGGPFPCFTQYPTIADTLDAAKVPWKYYTQNRGLWAGCIWNAFDAISNVRHGPDWTKDIISPDTRVLTDPGRGQLPDVSWVIPDLRWADYPAYTYDAGPSWVADIINNIGKSKYWNSTAIIVLWDDWGGWYDNVPPPQLDYVGLGVRVPLLIVSPYARRGYVSHTQYEYGSILKFIEQANALPSLHATDDRANSLIDSFDFTQKPRVFSPLPVKYRPTFFTSQSQSGGVGCSFPVD
jgi:phospholipase C